MCTFISIHLRHNLLESIYLNSIGDWSYLLSKLVFRSLYARNLLLNNSRAYKLRNTLVNDPLWQIQNCKKMRKRNASENHEEKKFLKTRNSCQAGKILLN